MDKHSNNRILINFFHSHGVVRNLSRGTVLFERDDLVSEVRHLERGYIKLARMEQPGDG